MNVRWSYRESSGAVGWKKFVMLKKGGQSYETLIGKLFQDGG